jgi:hypothetical protein
LVKSSRFAAEREMRMRINRRRLRPLLLALLPDRSNNTL